MDNHSLLPSRIHSLSNLAYSFFQVRRPHRSTPWLTQTNTSMYSLQQYTKQRTTRAFWHVSPCVRLSVSQVIIVRRRCPAGNERVAYSNERKWSTQSNSFVLRCSATTHSRCATICMRFRDVMIRRNKLLFSSLFQSNYCAVSQSQSQPITIGTCIAHVVM